MASEVHCIDCNTLIGYTTYTGPTGMITCPNCQEQAEADEAEGSE